MTIYNLLYYVNSGASRKARDLVRRRAVLRATKWIIVYLQTCQLLVSSRIG